MCFARRSAKVGRFYRDGDIGRGRSALFRGCSRGGWRRGVKTAIRVRRLISRCDLCRGFAVAARRAARRRRAVLLEISGQRRHRHVLAQTAGLGRGRSAGMRATGGPRKGGGVGRAQRRCLYRPPRGREPDLGRVEIGEGARHPTPYSDGNRSSPGPRSAMEGPARPMPAARASRICSSKQGRGGPAFPGSCDGCRALPPSHVFRRVERRAGLDLVAAALGDAVANPLYGPRTRRRVVVSRVRNGGRFMRIVAGQLENRRRPESEATRATNRSAHRETRERGGPRPLGSVDSRSGGYLALARAHSDESVMLCGRPFDVAPAPPESCAGRGRRGEVPRRSARPWPNSKARLDARPRSRPGQKKRGSASIGHGAPRTACGGVEVN